MKASLILKIFKKHLVLVCFLIASIPALSNLMPTPHVNVNELFFSSDSCWIIELKYRNPSPGNIVLDSIFLSSSTGISKIRNSIPQNNEGYILVNADSLFSNLNINRFGDKVNITCHFRVGSRSYYYSHNLIFGTYRDAFAPAPDCVNSIGLIYSHGYVLIPPSLGFENGTELYGKLTGKLYDQNSKLITNGYFELDGVYVMKVDSAGNYLVNLFKDDYSFDQIYFRLGSIKNLVEIEPVEITIEPNVEINRDIYIKSTMLEIFYVENKKELVYINPNPVNVESRIRINTNVPLNSAELNYEFYNIRGIKIGQGEIKSNGIKVELPPLIEEGINFIRFIMDGHLIQTSKLLVTHNQ
jgi:hypothetical protein